MKKGWNTIRIAVLTGLLALTAALSACGEGTVTEAVSIETATKPSTTTPLPVSPTPSSTPTEDWFLATASTLFTRIAPFPQHCEWHDDLWNQNMVSPDGNWLANHCPYFSEASLKVIRRDGTKIWIIPFTEINPDNMNPNNSVNPIIYDLIPFHWTTDSQFIFFYPIYYNGPDSATTLPKFGEYHGPLYRLNTDSGMWNIIIDENPYSTYYSFSPTDRRLIYISELNPRPHSINILDLKTGDVTTIELDQNDYGAGNVVWSSDGLSFAYVTGYIDENFENLSFSVFVYNIQNGGLQTIMSESPDLCAPQEWTGANVLVLSCNEVDDSLQMVQPAHVLYFDLQNSQYISATPTP